MSAGWGAKKTIADKYMKSLPKYIKAKMTAGELRQLEGAEAAVVKKREEMAAAQATASQALRASPEAKRTQQLVNRGFRLEYAYFESTDKLEGINSDMRKKYGH